MDAAVSRRENEAMNNFAERPLELNIDELQAAWVALDRLACLRALKTDADHQHALQLVNALWGVVDGNSSHPLASLFDLLVSMISEYEKERYPMPQSGPHEMLAFMMEQGGRTAADLARILNCSHFEEILAGRRKIDPAMAAKLAQYFGVGPQLFSNNSKFD